MKKKQWTLKKYGNRKYEGKYSKTASGERIFELSARLKIGNRLHTVSFESASAAKKLGWVAA